MEGCCHLSKLEIIGYFANDDKRIEKENFENNQSSPFIGINKIKIRYSLEKCYPY